MAGVGQLWLQKESISSGENGVGARFTFESF